MDETNDTTGLGLVHPISSPLSGGHAGTDSRDWNTGQTILQGQYQIEGIVGKGGMGEVYLVRAAKGAQRERFAVKRARARDEWGRPLSLTAQGRRFLLTELLAWFDAPEHPHLVPLRFFRTQADEVLLFSEYLAGGTLLDWIEANPGASLGERLDLAIQFAWGLHALHTRGLVHQDVKPENVLLTNEGQLKVSDFGIARMRRSPGDRASSRTIESARGNPSDARGRITFYTMVAGSPAYWSPEQKQEWERLHEAQGNGTEIRVGVTRATDVWSWAASVLHLILRERNWSDWSDGVQAGRQLDQYMAKRAADRESLTYALVELLKRCLDADAARRSAFSPRLIALLREQSGQELGLGNRLKELEKRPATMLEIARVLQAIYEAETGKRYGRAEPSFPRLEEETAPDKYYERVTADGSRWDDPRAWTERALAAANDNRSVSEVLPPQGRSRRARAAADLLAFEEVQVLFEAAGAHAHRELAGELTRVHVQQARVHEYFGDELGALARYGEAIVLSEPRLDVGQRGLARDLGWAYTGRANVLAALGQWDAALADHKRAVAVMRYPETNDGSKDGTNALVAAYLNQANALRESGQFPTALSAYESLIKVLAPAANPETRGDLANYLALAYMNQADTHLALDQLPAALSGYERAAKIRERLDIKERGAELESAKARVYLKQADALLFSGSTLDAEARYESSIVIYERLVKQEGRGELASDLAKAYIGRANALGSQDEQSAATENYESAIGILEKLVHQEGRGELGKDLENARNQAKALALENRPSALPWEKKRPDALRDIGDILESLDGKESATASASHDVSALTEHEAVKFVNTMITEAYQLGASDIHVEASPGGAPTRIRFRKDGTMVLWKEIRSPYRNPIIARLKIMADLNPSEINKPQSGMIDFRRFSPLDIKLRVQTLPFGGGVEDVSIRTLFSGGEPLPLDKMGLSKRNLALTKEQIEKPYGLFLVSGPAVSGKSVTLNSMLGYLNTPDTKIVTVEDPVEIENVGLQQVAVNRKTGIDLSTAMNAIFNADADIIVIDKLHDTETMSAAIEASRAGYLVFSTIRASNAMESLMRLLDRGMDPRNFADTLLGILSQRLPRRLCKCKQAYFPRADEVKDLLQEYCQEGLKYVPTLDELKDMLQEYCQPDLWKDPKTAYEAIYQDWLKEYGNEKGELTLCKAVGCEVCGGTGYRGRVGVHEVLIISDSLKRLIQERASVAEMVSVALEEGMHTLKMDGIGKVLSGITDVAQLRAISIINDPAMTYMNKASALRSFSRFDEAVICYTRAIELNSSNGTAWCMRGACRMDWAANMQDRSGAISLMEQARTDYVRANELQPGNEHGKLNLLELEICIDRFALAAERARAIWPLLKARENRLICGWLGAIAALLGGIPNAEWTDYLTLLESREPELSPNAWSVVAIEGLIVRLKADAAFARTKLATIEEVHRLFLAHFGKAGPALR